MDLFSAAAQTFECTYAAAPMPALLLDRHACIKHANAAFVKLSGYDAARIDGAPVTEFLDGPAAEVTSACCRNLESGAGFCLRVHSGARLPVALLSVPLQDEQRVCRGWYLFFTGCVVGAPAGLIPDTPFDAMPETRDFLLKIIEASYDGIVIADMNDVCLHVNSALERITGYGRDFFAGRRFSDYIEVENWVDELNDAKVARVDETGQISYESVFRRQDGRVVCLEHGVSLVRDNAGECIATVWIVRDITDKKKAEQELKQAYDYRTRFFANVTHAFRTPLTLCIGPLENLLHGDYGTLPAPVAGQLTTVLNNSRLLLMMVDHLLDFSRLQSGTLPVARTRVDVRSMYATLLESLKAPCARKHIALECALPEDLPPLHTDPVHLRAAMHDVAACAIAAAPAGSRIVLAAASLPNGECEDGHAAAEEQGLRPGSMCLRVHCEGSSLSTAQCRRLVESSGVSETVADAGGFTMGIRMLHAQGLAVALGGRLAIEAEPAGGVCFEVHVPVKDAQHDTDVPVAEYGADACTCLETESDVDECGATSVQAGSTRPLILVAEDNRALRSYICSIVQRDYDTVAAGDGLEALEKMQSCTPDLILSDIMMPGMDGYAFLRTVKASEQLRSVPFVFLTARVDVEMKIAGLEEGADDYIIKPFNAQELMARIKALLRLRSLMMENAAQARQINTMSSRLQEKYRYGAIVGKSAPMRRMYQLLDSIRDSDANVLVSGETGTGKELVANAIHYDSRRSAGPLISVNCGAIPRELMEREFFGHVKGAYTGAFENRRGYFAEASGGTLFLDEVGEMDRDMQVKLLRVLERGEIVRVGDPIARRVDVRLIAATNKDLRAEIRAGRFREDLYYRLFVIPVHIPPLRERREDIPLLIDHFCEKLKTKMNVEIVPVSEQDYRFFMDYDYPGNVRELENLIERYCLLGGPVQELAGSMADSVQTAAAAPSTSIPVGDEVFNHPDPLKQAQRMAARDLIMRTLRQCGNNHAEAARKLGIARSSLYRKISEFESET